jgi:low temperature requirement protein LtrA
VLASGDDPGLRHSVTGLGVSTAIGVGVLLVGASFDGSARLVVWLVALVMDMAGPLFIDTTGWRLVPEHFAERHGLIVLVALGESIVSIGVGAERGVDRGVIAAAVLGIGVAFAMWWTYVDVAALAVTRRLAAVEDVKERNEMARDGFSYLHLPLVAAIVLVALGLKTTLAHVDEPLEWEAAAALVGGATIYLLAHVTFKQRCLAVLSRQRLVAAAGLLVVLPFAHRLHALVTVGAVCVVYWALVAYETVRYADDRRAVRAGEA